MVASFDLQACKANCSASGFCCDRDSGCQRPSCAVGCEIASISSDLAQCRSFCQQAEGTCVAFPPTVEGCVRQAFTCMDCEATCGSGRYCEPSGGCEHSCEQFFNQRRLSTLQKEHGELERCPQFGNESKMEYLSDDIFTFWWQTGFETLPVAQYAAKVFSEVRQDVLAKGMPDPPNIAKGYYFNVYLHRGAQDDFPPWGAGVGTNKLGLPFMTLGSDVDTDLWRHEAFHVFQYSTKGIDYSGDTQWATETTASYYALIHDKSGVAAFVNNIAVSNNPHLALWHSFDNGPAEEVGFWDYGVRQYGMQSMLWWITRPRSGQAPWVDEDLIYAALLQETPYSGGLQAYLFDHDPEGFRQGFLDWAAHTTNDHDYLTAEQRAHAERNMMHSEGPSFHHPFAARSENRTDALYTLRPDAALKPRGWAYNVILLSDTAPGNYTFRLSGESKGSEGAGAHFLACALVADEASADIVNFRMESGLEGFVQVHDQPSGGTIKLIIAATPANFSGNQNYGYSIDVQVGEQPNTTAPSPVATSTLATSTPPQPTTTAPSPVATSTPLLEASCAARARRLVMCLLVQLVVPTRTQLLKA
eukprot:TRINITY_DN3849_c0_g1_i1.p1 TRINITY_DN3849_c0_g1~~TRINITY_DN3849_c0_g1_i1.p1  ORF type:complete len:624 (+),score=75.96 TRINITY_DN3849_c0_g1_i1:109-1872(+)